MSRHSSIAVVSLLSVLAACSFLPVTAAEPISVGDSDWPWWRGPNRNGTANPDQDPPLHWSESENVLWSAEVPGRGHGSPIVVGDQVLLATADLESNQQVVLCFDRNSGAELWSTVVHDGGVKPEGRQPNEKASMASSTIACDGNRLFINFLNGGALWSSALDRDGNLLWQTKVSDYEIHQGYGASPTLWQDLVLVSADNKGGGAIAGLNREDGSIQWKRERPKKPNYCSPIVLQAGGKDQLVMIGCDLVTSLNPLTGETNWEIEGATTECVTSTVTDGGRIFTSGGYPDNHISAVAAFGKGGVVWRNNTRAYVPSLLQKDGYLYATLDAGVAMCLKCDTGEELWKGRLAGTFSSSPVLVGDRIYATNEEGTTFVFRATPDDFEELAQNKLGESVFATPAICGSRIYTRVAHIRDGRRQEVLYCLGTK
ncbi:MAG: PQQ-binding-like beta-propeller repeat protein [Planctomycetaceae bacterium]